MGNIRRDELPEPGMVATLRGSVFTSGQRATSPNAGSIPVASKRPCQDVDVLGNGQIRNVAATNWNGGSGTSAGTSSPHMGAIG